MEYSVLTEDKISTLFEGLKDLHLINFLVEAYRAQTFILSSAPKTPVDFAAVYAMSHNNSKPMLKKVAQEYHLGMFPRILINGSEGQALNNPEPYVAWPGSTKYIQWLVEFGVPMRAILKTDKFAYHTRDSAKIYIDFALENTFTRMVSFTGNEQVLRAALGQTKEFNNRQLTPNDVRMYYICEDSWDPARLVRGPQGAAQMTRHELTLLELGRIAKYQGPEFQHLSSFKELHDNVVERDQGDDNSALEE